MQILETRQVLLVGVIFENDSYQFLTSKLLIDKILDLYKLKACAEDKSMGECNTILSAYTTFRHLEWYCSHSLKCRIALIIELFIDRYISTF